ncbi:MAG: mandelate racemase/muconate lactonizing enzyme family protein [Gammaproteobacteria bacterium]
MVWRAPIDVPVVTSFGAMADRPVLLLRVEDQDGAHGWGEVWVNFPGCGAEHRARLVETVLGPLVLNRPLRHPGELFDHLRGRLRLLTIQAGEPGPLAQVTAGLDIALWDLAARKLGRPVRALLNPAAGAEVPAYASGVHPDELRERIDAVRDRGFRAYKLKVGFDDRRDADAVREALAILGGRAALMVDANQAWDLARALRMCNRLGNLDLAWLEEPLAADAPAREWRALAAESRVALAAGENVRGSEEFARLIGAGPVSVVQPDMCKWGGFSGCLPVARSALEAGRRYCPHFLGSGLGLVASAQLLAAAGGDGLLEMDVNPNPLREVLAQPFPRLASGQFPLPVDPGLGVEPDLAAAKPWLVMHRQA